jgi:hypothetical protein
MRDGGQVDLFVAFVVKPGEDCSSVTRRRPSTLSLSGVEGKSVQVCAHHSGRRRVRHQPEPIEFRERIVNVV